MYIPRIPLILRLCNLRITRLTHPEPIKMFLERNRKVNSLWLRFDSVKRCMLKIYLHNVIKA